MPVDLAPLSLGRGPPELERPGCRVLPPECASGYDPAVAARPGNGRFGSGSRRSRGRWPGRTRRSTGAAFVDLDGDGMISLYEMEYFYHDIERKLLDKNFETLSFNDVVCNVCFSILHNQIILP